MRVLVADPAAYTPPYDHALCAALARAGAEVELATTRFAHGHAPEPAGYARSEAFYPRRGRGGERGRRAARLAQHVPGMLALRRRARAFDVVHVQWLPVQPLDVHLLPRERPVVITAHDVLPREPRPGQLRATRRLLRRADAVVVHSEHGRRRLAEIGVTAATIAHGAFEHLTELDGELPGELHDTGAPVVLHFGLLRPYKGLDVLLDAWHGISGRQLWVVGAPRMPLPAALPAGVQLVPRFVSDREAAALFRRADVAVLPYRDSEGSGVLATAQAFGVPLVLSDVGAFAEIEGARLVAPGDPDALREALLAPPPSAPPGVSWDEVARRHLELYATLAP